MDNGARVVLLPEVAMSENGIRMYRYIEEQKCHSLIPIFTQVSKVGSDLVLDDGIAKKLWEASETLVRLQPEERHC